MEAVAGGELSQLAELYHRYRDPIYGFLYNRCQGDVARAEDLLQDAFERVIKYRETYRPGSSFRTWMFTIARNTSLDDARRATRLRRKEAMIVEEMPLSEPSILQEWMKRERNEQCKAALMALSPEYREVVDLAWKRGLKYREIATVLGITEGNVKVRVHRACHQLRLNYGKMVNG